MLEINGNINGTIHVKSTLDKVFYMNNKHSGELYI